MRNCNGNKVAGIEESGGNSNNEGDGGSGKSDGDGIREGIDDGDEEGNGDGRKGKWRLLPDCLKY